MLRSSIAGFALLVCSSAFGYTIEFDHNDFTRTNVFNNVSTFSFKIDVAGPLAPGVYTNPVLNSVDYALEGTFPSGSPSGFPGFNLMRSITGADFYAQGSSLQFEIAAGADLLDGLQLSDLVGADPVFVLNAREVGTGRYHPPLLELNADGTGTLRNSNNMGGINPATMMEVDVAIGEEYIVNLGPTGTPLTLAQTPEPSTGMLLGGALLLGAVWRRRRSRCA